LRKKLVIASAALVALALAGTAAYAAVTANFQSGFKPNKAGKSASVAVKYTITDPAAPQPPINNRVQITFPSGGKWNGPKFPKCSVAILLGPKGTSGCPPKSKLGTGSGIGYAKPVVTDPVNGKLTIFNGGSSILVYVFPDLGPTFVVTCRISGGYNLDCGIPPIKTLPSAPDAAVGAVTTKTKVLTIKKGKKKIGIVVTPKKCKGSWKSSAKFSFATGETVTAPFSQKCKK
jgi:hypothetical protein